jgi:type I restriction enzyme R subunit
MESINFEFLRPYRPELAALGGLAESYAQPDPDSALVKLRTFAEQLVAGVYEELGLPAAKDSSLYDLMSEAAFRAAVPKVIVSKLHSLRVNGNKAAHGDRGSVATALWILREAFDLSCWYHVAFRKGDADSLPQFVEPAATGSPAGKEEQEQSKKERREILARLAAQEAQMQQLLADLDAARQKAQAAETKAADIQTVARQAQEAADVLRFDEATTRRRMIDSALVAAGWDVGADGRSTEQVGQEVLIPHQPNKTGEGYADYVLYGDDGKPLAVVEAKKTVVEPELGRKQAELYADGLERQHGQRPVIFYTNGFDIYIRNDAMGETPRLLHGFYSKDSLEYLIYQRHNRKNLADVAPNPEIAGRMYQIEAVKRVAERFSDGHRKALIVQATGTGKTRVAVSLSELLSRALWAKRILFLCDRRELRKQANNVFKEFLPGEPRTDVTAATAQDRDKRIYMATYPAMMKCFQSFDVGFFDLIIADESHRSIYNRYRDLFVYFDCRQVGLTATPVRFINRNTYKLFGCEDKDPTAYFSYEDAINHKPPYLVPFEVFKTTTEFLRRGIKYSQMSEEQREQLEEDEGDPSLIEYDAAQVDRVIFNKDTNRAVLRNLMENGVRDATGSRPGKTIVFARSHNHAVLLQQLFDEMYPQYGGNFCRVIDTHDPRAEQLIDDFKGTGTNPSLTIAISVDMLDTGIDIPEVVNLVFAKPVKSYVKFWQMIGRGTRLSPNLFGPGKDKEFFRIFDHWGNFEFFEEHYREAEPSQQKSLLQRLFEARIQLADAAIKAGYAETFDATIDLIGKDIADLPEGTISVKEKWRELQAVRRGDALQSYSAATRATLLGDIAPLMQWRNVESYEAAFEFDLLMTRLQTERLKRSATFDTLKQELLDEVSKLPLNLNAVRRQWDLITEVRGGAFWERVSPPALENVRQSLRGLMGLIDRGGGGAARPKVIDVAEDRSKIETERHIPKLEGLQLAAYRHRVEQVLLDLMDESIALQKIKRGQPVSERDLEELCALVLAQDPSLNLRDLEVHFPELADHLDLAIRGIIGLQPEAVDVRFHDFVHRHPELNSKQIRFLSLLKNHLTKFGSIEVERLYEPPFTAIDGGGLDGVFTNEEQINELLTIIASFNPPAESAPNA